MYLPSLCDLVFWIIHVSLSIGPTDVMEIGVVLETGIEGARTTFIGMSKVKIIPDADLSVHAVYIRILRNDSKGSDFSKWSCL